MCLLCTPTYTPGKLNSSRIFGLFFIIFLITRTLLHTWWVLSNYSLGELKKCKSPSSLLHAGKCVAYPRGRRKPSLRTLQTWRVTLSYWGNVWSFSWKCRKPPCHLPELPLGGDRGGRAAARPATCRGLWRKEGIFPVSAWAGDRNCSQLRDDLASVNRCCLHFRGPSLSVLLTWHDVDLGTH